MSSMELLLSDADAATAHIKRIFNDIFCDLSSPDERAYDILDDNFEQHSDGKVIDRNAFVSLMQVQKARLASTPRFTWSELVATAPREGRVHVTSVHSVSLHLRDGTRLLQKVVALIQLDDLREEVGRVPGLRNHA